MKTRLPSLIPDLGPPIIEKHLVAGERILWIGKPNAQEYAQPHRRRAAIASVLLLPVAAWLLGLAVINLSLTYMGGCLVIAVLLVAFWASPAETIKKVGHIRYTVTNRRVVIEYRQTILTSNHRMARVDIKIEDIRPTLKMARGHCGSIRLGHPGLSMEYVDNARDLYQTLLETTAGATSQPSYYAAGIDKTAPPLRLGETVLWSGRPDLIAYLLSETALGVFWAAITFLCMAGMTSGLTPTWAAVLTLYGQICAYGIPAIIVLGALRASGLRYFVTNERVLVRRPWTGPQWMERELSKTTNARVYRRLRRSATIVFDKRTETFHGFNGGVTVWTEVSFHAVPDYQNVMGLVATARRPKPNGRQ